MTRFLPFLEWLPNYRKRNLPGDFIAGLTIAIMLVPQCMAYALLAGLPPIVGLYAGILPVLVYGLLGSTHTLTLGPTAITSVMALASIGHLAEQGTESYLTLTFTLTLCLGIVYLLMGLLRLGFIVNLLGQPVLIGYINAAALVIIFSQIRHLTGIPGQQTSQPYDLLLQPLKDIEQLNFAASMIGLSCIGGILVFRIPLNHFLKRSHVRPMVRFTITRSAPLVVIILATLAVYGFRLDERSGVPIIGRIPKGLPTLRIGPFDLEQVKALLPGAVAIAFVGIMEGISTAKSLVSQSRQRFDANQELVAMGMANLASAASGGYTVTTSISRSAANHMAGANTGLSSVIAAALLSIVVMLLTPIFYYLPNAALAAIVITSVIRLINVTSIQQLWHYSRAETLPFVITFLAVFTTSIEIGILAGVLAAIVLHLWQTGRPRIIQLGRVGYSEYYRDVTRHETVSIPHVRIIRVDESLYFANVQYLDETLRNLLAEYPETKYLVVVCSAINTIDASALQILSELIDEFQEAGVEVYLAELKERVMDNLQRSVFVNQVGAERFFSTTHEAVQATKQLLDDELPI